MNTQQAFNPELFAAQHTLAPYACYPAKPEDKDLFRLSEITSNQGQRRPVFPLIGVSPNEDTSDIPRSVLLYMNPMQ